MNTQDNKKIFLQGVKTGMPICLGYFAVAFTLGITAKNAGLTPWQAFLSTLLTNASAGGYAAFTVIAAAGSYLEMAIMELVANARYLLMSCSLSQKLSPQTGLIPRMIIGFDVTDEIFGASIAVEGHLPPVYSYGMMSVAIPGWALGTLLGCIMGNILPDNIVSALSVGLYGMFIAIIIPPARKSRIIAALVIISMVSSFIFSRIPALANISAGMKTIILTVVIAGIAAILFPVNEADQQPQE